MKKNGESEDEADLKMGGGRKGKLATCSYVEI